jgi:NTE family protein
MKPAASKHAHKKRLNLALQGGGSHGAFTWGVLHRIMEDGRLFIDGISGASAGALNGVVFADGFLKGKRQGAIEALGEFWRSVSQHSPFTHSVMRSVATPMGKVNLDDTPLFQMFDATSRLFSPYQFNPFNINPLKAVLEEHVDFGALRRHREIRLFIAATNVHKCKSRLFRTPEITVDTVLASTCLPMLYQAVEIEGEHYWDGGYLGNPAIYPLIHECPSNDVLIVMINPLRRKDVPDTAREILNRVTEISFNASLISEMRNFTAITKLIESGELKSRRYARVNFHLIEPPEELADYSASSKFNADWDFLRYLHDLGWEAADKWLKRHYAAIGKNSSLDVYKRFLDHD